MATKKVQIVVEVDKKGATRKYKKFAGDVTKQNKKIRSELNKTKAASAGLGLNLKSLAAAAGGLFIFGKVNSFIRDSIRLAGEQASAEAKVEATIKATGSAAGVTTEELKKMASELQNVTLFGDEVTLRGQSMLLTFKQIGTDVFPRATASMLDLATAMGTDVKESAIQLGKALNDPKTGLTALRRVGITFTKEQENLIKNFQATGDIASAQKLILEELESQFGGLAQAVAESGTGPLIQFGNVVGDVQELLGDALIPLLVEMTKEFKEFLIEGQKTGDLQTTFKAIAGTLRFLFVVTADVFNQLKGVFQFVAGAINNLAGVFLLSLSVVVDAVSNLVKRLPDRLVPDGWIEGIDSLSASLEDLGKAGTESGTALFDDGVGSFEKGQRTVKFFKELTAGTKELKKELKDLPPAAGGPTKTTGTTQTEKEKAAREKAVAAQAAADTKSIQAERDKFDKAFAIREEFRRKELSQDEQDLLEFQDNIIAKNETLRAGGFLELSSLQLIADEKARIQKVTADLEKQEADDATDERLQKQKDAAELEKQIRAGAASDVVSNLEVLANANKKFGALFKTAAISQTVIDTFASAQAAFKSLAGIPLVGPALGAAAATAATVAGFARVASIKNQKFADGGIVQGPRTGDTVSILANGGERVIPAAENARFESFLKGGGGSTVITFQAPTINIANGDPQLIRRAITETMSEQIQRFSEQQRNAKLHGLPAV